MLFTEWDLNLKVRIIAETINSILFWMFYPFMTLYFIEQFGEQLSGLLMTIPPLLGIFSILYGGFAADHYGRKKTMIYSIGLQSLFLLLFAFSVNHLLDYLAFIGLTVMGSIYHPASMAMVADLVPIKDRRIVFAYFYTAVNIGVVIGPSIGAFFFFKYRFELILFSAITTFFIFIILTKILHETKPSSTSNSMVELGVLAQLKNYLVLLKNKIFALYLLAGILISQVFMQLDLYLGAYLTTYFQKQTLQFYLISIEVTGEKLFGWIVSENGLVVVLFTVYVSKFIEKWSDEKALIISSILFGISFWLMAFSTDIWYLMSLMVLFTLAELIRTPVIQNFITKIAPEDKRGQYLGASSLQFSVGRTIAPLFITLSAYYQPITIFTMILSTSLLSAAIYKWLFVIYRRERANS